MNLENRFHETKIHCKADFPYMVYRGNLPDYITSYPVHWHKEMEIIFIISGRGTVTVQTTQYVVKAGDIIIITPELLHSIKQLNDEKMEYFNILFDFLLLEDKNSYCFEKYLKGIFEHTKSIPICLRKNQELTQLLTPYLEYLIANRKKKFSGDELMVKSNLFAILHNLCKNSDTVAESETKLDESYVKIKKVIYYVWEHYDEKISVDQAAKLINYSASYFSKLFHKLTGTSFTQYLKEYRLEVAANRLINTDKTVTEISAETGFCNLPYFTRAFEKKFGVTPNQYKKRR